MASNMTYNYLKAVFQIVRFLAANFKTYTFEQMRTTRRRTQGA